MIHYTFIEDLLLASSAGNDRDTDAEQGARLTCHLLLRMFQSTSTLPGHMPDSKNGLCIKSSCDRHLLEAAHNSITVGAVVAVLKAVLMLGKIEHNYHIGTEPYWPLKWFCIIMYFLSNRRYLYVG